MRTTYLHTAEDTTFRAAAEICSSLGSDLCTKSQYVLLNDAALFAADVQRWTNEMSDNDLNFFDPIVGSNTGDNPSWSNLAAFTCCRMDRPTDLSCPSPGTLHANGLCTMSIHDTEDSTFFDAARDCASFDADVCSNSQMQALRDNGLFFGESWTASGADSDSSRAGGLLATQLDNPNPASTTYGYACCL